MRLALGLVGLAMALGGADKVVGPAPAVSFEVGQKSRMPHQKLKMFAPTARPPIPVLTSTADKRALLVSIPMEYRK